MGYKASKFLALLCCCFLASGCSDVVQQTKEDLGKYPELNLFFDAAGDFLSGSANLDVGGSLLIFKPVKQVSSGDLFQALNTKATSQGWKLKQNSESEWTYERTVEQEIALPMRYSVNVELDYRSNEVIIVWDRAFIQLPNETNSR